jgi:hypothetical protein
MRTKATYVLVVLALGCCGAAYAALSDGHHDPGKVRAAGAHAGSHLRVSGHVLGLYPEARRWIGVVIRNRSSRRALVRAVRADVVRGAPGCSRDNLATAPKHLRHPRIRPHRSRRTRIRVRMLGRAPDACQGVRFPLRFKLRVRR